MLIYVVLLLLHFLLAHKQVNIHHQFLLYVLVVQEVLRTIYCICTGQVKRGRW